MLTSSRDLCWCGLPVHKHIEEAEKIEAKYGTTAKDKPRPRRNYKPREVKDLDYGTDGDSVDT